MSRAGMWVVFVVVVVMLSSWARAQFPETATRRGNKYLREGKYDEARTAYGRALRRDTAYFPAMYNMGHTAYGDSSWMEALSWWRRALEHSHDTLMRSRIYYNMGNALLQAGRVEESVKAYINALRLNPYDDSARYNLSYALRLLRHRQQQNQPQGGGSDQRQNDQNQQSQHQPQQKSGEPHSPSSAPLPASLAQQQVNQLLQIATEEERKAAERILKEREKSTAKPLKPW